MLKTCLNTEGVTTHRQRDTFPVKNAKAMEEKKTHLSLHVQVLSQAPAHTHFPNLNACLFTPMSFESVYLILVKFVSIILLSLLVQ